MTRYHPKHAPDPHTWLAMDDDERARLVEDYHHRMHIRLDNPRLHAMAHVLVEHQIAVGDAMPVRRTLDRLMRQGLNRHDAIHAIGAVLFEQMRNVTANRGADPDTDLNIPYFAALERLTPESWRRDYSQEKEQ